MKIYIKFLKIINKYNRDKTKPKEKGVVAMQHRFICILKAKNVGCFNSGLALKLQLPMCLSKNVNL